MSPFYQILFDICKPFLWIYGTCVGYFTVNMLTLMQHKRWSTPTKFLWSRNAYCQNHMAAVIELYNISDIIVDAAVKKGLSNGERLSSIEKLDRLASTTADAGLVGVWHARAWKGKKPIRRNMMAVLMYCGDVSSESLAKIFDHNQRVDFEMWLDAK